MLIIILFRKKIKSIDKKMYIGLFNISKDK